MRTHCAARAVNRCARTVLRYVTYDPISLVPTNRKPNNKSLLFCPFKYVIRPIKFGRIYGHEQKLTKIDGN